MYVLGINKLLNSSAILLKDGEIVSGVQEERISRVKNDTGFPNLAIDAVLKEHNLTVDDLDLVCIGEQNPKVPLSRQDDLNKFHNRYGKIKEKWFGDSNNAFAKFARRGVNKIRSLGNSQSTVKEKTVDDFLKERGIYDKHLKFDHHTCHAAAAYYGLGRELHEKYLVFSLDGGGDGRTSAVFIGHNNKLEEIAASDSFSPACLYAHITYILGFLPHEHEYKLMGLAAYAQKTYAETVRDVLYQFIGFDRHNPLVLNNTDHYPEVQNSRGEAKQMLIHDLFKSVLNFRFDTMAAGLQLLAEEVAVRWIKAGIEQTGIRKVLLCGGFFMNVKANKLIAELPEVEFVNCFPSCGDETIAIGSAFLGYHQKRSPEAPQINFGNFCIGPEASFDLDEAREKFQEQVIFEEFDDINSEVVRLLLDRKIVARCSGQMEFGARALGNRSIIAAPDDMRIINKINAAIKKRDFWMPFAPAMMQDKADILIDIPDSMKIQYSPYMMFTFQAKSEMADKFIAGIHQADKTARAQLVNPELYPDFYDIIARYYAQTGIPAVLNTSFNLHGYPIVQGAVDAVEVYLNSALDVVVINNYKVTRKE